MYRLALIALAIIVGAIALVGCGDSGKNTPQQAEAKIRQNSYARLAAAQPAHTMDYSPSRDTINFWIDTWGKSPGKLSYVYLQAANGQLIGYYVFKGLPVSYCAALTPTYEILDVPNDGVGAIEGGGPQVPAPGVDGVYYSGGQCSAYYGRDASSNSYIEYTVGQGISALVYERPLPRQDVEPLGFTTIKRGG